MFVVQRIICKQNILPHIVHGLDYLVGILELRYAKDAQKRDPAEFCPTHSSDVLPIGIQC